MGALTAITQPLAVNSQGVAVGVMSQISGGCTAFAWSISGGIRSIAPPFSSCSEARDISDSGYVAGWTVYGSDPAAATRWYPGTFTAGTASYDDFALKVLEDGTIYGYSTSWDLNNQPQSIASDSDTLVEGMSGVGRRVGPHYIHAGVQIFTRAWTAAPNSISVQILPVPAGIRDSYAIAVNTCGAILGSVAYDSGKTQAVLWTKPVCDQPVLK
jgi:uncharacterized membrane protein